MSSLIRNLQEFMRNSRVFKELFESQEVELDKRNELISSLLIQLSVSTATWALEMYEKEVGLPVDYTKPYSERRSKIIAKLRGVGVVNAELIKIVVQSWTGGTVDVEFSDGVITVSFVDEVGIPTNIADVEDAIEEIKPAHLSIEYKFKYNLWSSLYEYTWGELQSLTWEQILSGDLTELVDNA